MIESAMVEVNKLGRAQFPSPVWDRVYQVPARYPNPTVIKRAVLDPLGTFLFGLACWKRGVVDSDALEMMTASYLTRFKAHKWDHPLYLITPELTEMLLHTDKLDQPNIDKDSKPPFPAGHFVLPRGMLGTPDGAYVTVVSFAILHTNDFKDADIGIPDNARDERRFYVTAEMSDGVSYFAKLKVDDAGIVQNPDDTGYDDLVERYGRDEPDPAEHAPCKFVVNDGPAILSALCNLTLAIFTFLGMDREQDTVTNGFRSGVAKAKKGRPFKEFFTPAVIGTNLVPTGVATQGNHASPLAHIRRGHWRRVHYGKGLVEVKRMWIKPCLVMGRKDVGQ